MMVLCYGMTGLCYFATARWDAGVSLVPSRVGFPGGTGSFARHEWDARRLFRLPSVAADVLSVPLRPLGYNRLLSPVLFGVVMLGLY